MDFNSDNDRKLAVLIDADNISHKYINYMMSEIAKYGTPTYKRIYGDWTQPNLNSWKPILLENALTPIQQYSYTTGKNSTDSALIIDAMDILYSSNVEGFCIVSSDSDFTRLATRLREAGKYVIGIGEHKTPSAFIASCEKFIYLEVLVPQEPEPESVPARRTSAPEPPAPAPAAQKPSAQQGGKQLKKLKEITPLIRSVVDDIADEDGWAFLGEVGSLLVKRKPDFDPRNFGFLKMGKLIEQLDSFDIDCCSTSNPNIKHIYIRNR